MDKKLILVQYIFGKFEKEIIELAKETDKQYRDKHNGIYSKSDEGIAGGKYSTLVFEVLYDEEKQFEDLKGKLFNYELNKLNGQIERLEKEKNKLTSAFYKED